MKEKKILTIKEVAKMGGEATKRKYGKKHFSKIGQLKKKKNHDDTNTKH